MLFFVSSPQPLASGPYTNEPSRRYLIGGSEWVASLVLFYIVRFFLIKLRQPISQAASGRRFRERQAQPRSPTTPQPARTMLDGSGTYG